MRIDGFDILKLKTLYNILVFRENIRADCCIVNLRLVRSYNLQLLRES